MLNIPYGRQYITEEDIEAVVRTLKSDYLTQGPLVGEFEKAFAQYVQADYAVAVSNGSTALHLAVEALGLQKGEKVITTPITFAASANCVRYCEGEVVFADIDPLSLNLDINKVREILEAATPGEFAGIIPVSFAGYPVDMEAYRQLADEFGLWLIEDACHAPGASFTDSKAEVQYTGNGNYADITVFSFHPVKHIATGEGGMLTTNNPELFNQLQLLRTHGITKDSNLMKDYHGPWYYEMQTLGYNYRLPDMACALGISQLERANKGLERRRLIAKRYDQAFVNSNIKTQNIPAGIQHAYHLYIIQITNRSDLYNHLREKGIYAQVHYIPVHTMPYYKDLGWKEGDCPVAENYYSQCLSLPMYPSLKDEEQEQIIQIVKHYCNENISNHSSQRRKQAHTA